MRAPAVTPQINFPQQQQAAVAGAPAQLPRPRPGIQFEDHLRNLRMHIKQEREKTRKLCEMGVTLHRRYRGLTLDDLCGRYGIRRATDGRWMSYDADLDGEIHPINIVEPAISANTNACLQSNPSIEVDSRTGVDARSKQIAMRWQRVADFFQADNFPEHERAVIFDSVQKTGTIQVELYIEELDKQSVPDVSGGGKQGIARFRCGSCNTDGITKLEGAEMQDGMQQIACPQCQQPADAIVKSIDMYALGEAEVPVYEIKMRLRPFFNFNIDRYGSRVKGIEGAKWLSFYELCDKIELETDYPQHTFTAATSWSFPTQCDYALATSDWRFLNYIPSVDRQKFVADFEKFEKETIYLHEEAYSNYIAPADYEFVNAKGERTFAIKRGQSIGEAFEALYGFNPKGFKFVWEGDRLLDIISPEKEELNFREVVDDIHWQRDSSGYLASPNYSLVYIQDDITMINTMDHNITARNAVIPTYYDSLVFEGADFSKEYIGSKNAHLLGDERDIRKSAFQLPVPTPTPHLAERLTFLWEIKDTVSQVQPAMRGEAQKGETFGAQRQQLEQSYGGLTSVLQSYAQCVVGTFKKYGRIAAKLWTLEQFQMVASAFGETWTDEDVQEMCAIDFDRDLRVSYRPGSEMPESNLSREMKFVNGLGQLMPFIQAGVIGPDKLQKILQKIDEFADFDFDLTGLEVNELVAQKRFIELATICSNPPFENVTFEQIEQARNTVIAMGPPEIDPQTGLPGPPQPVTQLDTITERIFYATKIRFSQYEDLPQQHAFFVEQLRAETGKTKPNYLLLEMLSVLLGMLDMANQAIAAQQLAADPIVQAQKAEAEKARGAEKEDADREDANRDKERQASVEDQGRQFVQGLITDGAAQQHDLQKTALQGAMSQSAAKEKAKATTSKKK